MSRFIGFVSSYFGNSAVRFNVGILLGLLLNFSYTVFSLIVGIVYEDAWYVSAAAYYTLVAVLRYLLIGASSERGGQITSQTVSILITILFVPMSGIIMYTVLDERFRIPHRAPVVLFGLYAAFAVLRALYGIIFSRKKRFSN